MHEPPGERQSQELRNRRPKHQLRDFQRPVAMHYGKKLRHEIGGEHQRNAECEVESDGDAEFPHEQQAGRDDLERREARKESKTSPRADARARTPEDQVALEPETSRSLAEDEDQG